MDPRVPRARAGALLDPCIPRNWPGYSIDFRYHSATYKSNCEKSLGFSRGIASTSIDGKVLVVAQIFYLLTMAPHISFNRAGSAVMLTGLHGQL